MARGKGLGEVGWVGGVPGEEAPVTSVPQPGAERAGRRACVHPHVAFGHHVLAPPFLGQWLLTGCIDPHSSAWAGVECSASINGA